MKGKLCLLAIVAFFAGCSLFSSPQATAKKFMAAAQKGDADSMTQLFSSRAIQRLGVETIKENNQKFSELTQKAFSELTQKANEGGSYALNNLTESKEGNNARVALTYQNKDHSMRLVFALSKEGSSWKIDNIGGSELEKITDLASAELKDGPKKLEPTVTAPAISVPDAPPAVPDPPHAPISGGVLNSKATNLPQPPYPPIARSVKASGTVVVQVTVDESGNVISAQAISGHPLLQAVSVAAARSAKFEPTKLSGKPVKVNGIINYTFEPPAK